MQSTNDIIQVELDRIEQKYVRRPATESVKAEMLTEAYQVAKKYNTALSVKTVVGNTVSEQEIINQMPIGSVITIEIPAGGNDDV